MIKKLVPNTMLRTEWRHLRERPIVAISLSVILLIPIMYAGFFLGSIWNPYGNTGNLPVAVVNNDTGAELSGAQTNIGDQVVDTLKQNHDMGWQFVSETQANKGIQDGTYYMEIVIPADFSHNAATVTSAQPKSSTLTYTITPSKNFVASLLTTEAAKSIKQNVATTINRAYVSALLAALQTTADGIHTASEGAAALTTGSRSLQAGITEYTAGVTQVTEGQTALASGLSALNTGATSLKNGTTSLASQLPTTSQIAQLTAGVAQIQTGITGLHTAVTTADPTVSAAQVAVTADATSLQQLLVTYGSQASAGSTSLTNLSAAAAIANTTVMVSTSDLATVLGLLNTSQQIAQHSATLLTDLNTLTNALTAQRTQLIAGVTSLHTGMNTLAPNLTNALNGYTSVASGVSVLQTGTGQLQSGVSAAYQGSQQVLGGLRLLDQQSVNLQSGASQLATGTSTLSVGLAAADQKLSLQPTGSATLDHIVTPITLQEKTQGSVPNYGYALSPYVLSLGLYVGALVFNVIYPVRRVFDKAENARRWWLAKMSVAFSVSVGQALVLVAVMVWGLGLHPANPGLFVLLTILTSMTFMAIITFLVIMLDNIGRFIAMLLLVLQLGSSGGVFPIVLSSGFFQFMNPFMPMTYSIRAFREAISSGLGLSTYWHNTLVLVLIGIAASACLIIFLHVHGMRHFKHEAIEET